MANISVGDVNQYLGTNKLQIASFSSDLVELEVTVANYVLAKLVTAYPEATTWTTEALTPKLVQSIIAMRMAGFIYIRQYGEEASRSGSYGRYLLSESDKWCDGLISGELTLDEVVPSLLGLPDFYPTDIATEAPAIFGDDDELILFPEFAEAPRFASIKDRF